LSATRIRLGLLLCAVAVLGTCARPPSLLEEVQRVGELRVVTRNAPTAYYMDGGGPSGPEYELLKGFADELHVRLRLIVVENAADVLPTLIAGQAHLAAAGLTVNPDSERVVDFGPAYQQVTEHLVYRDGRRRPRDLLQLRGKRLEVPSGTSYVKTLTKAQAQVPDLVWTENPHADQNELLSRVAKGSLDYTVVKSNTFAMYRSFIPEIRVAFNLAEGESVAWAFPKRADASLRQAAERYFARIRASGELDHIMDEYYGHVPRANYVGTKQFLQDVRSRLPAYRSQFKAAAAEFGLDWRLLAAIGYQESKWNPEAVSSTGVRGLMMLTEETALTFGVDDRTDPAQSIRGGAQYIAHIMAKIPRGVVEPDRTSFALATYNMGYGHLLDARRLTRDAGGDWNRWVDVRPNVKRLADPDFAAQSRHGFARGGETAYFVDNVQTYFNVLAYMTRDEVPLPDWMQQRSPAPIQADLDPGERRPQRLAARRNDDERS
jgi:membrane-bound lytic murein transglycosylase F